MKVITKYVNIESKEFYLVSDFTNDGRKYYATIPYENTRDGVIKGMNGAQMCISFNSPAEAIENRIKDIKLNRLLDKYIAKGLDRKSAVMAMIEDPDYQAIYA